MGHPPGCLTHAAAKELIAEFNQSSVLINTQRVETKMGQATRLPDPLMKPKRSILFGFFGWVLYSAAGGSATPVSIAAALTAFATAGATRSSNASGTM